MPQDIAVTGHDDILTARLFMPAITTVREPRHRMAKLVSSVLVDMLQGRAPVFQSQVLTPRVVVRHSTGRAESTRGQGDASSTDSR